MKFIMVVFSFMLQLAVLGQGKFFGGNGDGFASATLTNLVLPVTDMNFTVIQKTGYVEANFSAKVDNAVCRMVLERAVNATNFYPIDSIITRPAYFQVLEHTFLDHSPIEGVNFYRVKIKDCNGGITYSGIRSIQIKTAKTTFTYLASSNQLRYTDAFAGSLQLHNNIGQVIYRQRIAAGSGLLTLPHLLNGIYFIQLEPGKTQTIIIQR